VYWTALDFAEQQHYRANASVKQAANRTDVWLWAGAQIVLWQNSVRMQTAVTAQGGYLRHLLLQLSIPGSFSLRCILCSSFLMQQFAHIQCRAGRTEMAGEESAGTSGITCAGATKELVSAVLLVTAAAACAIAALDAPAVAADDAYRGTSAVLPAGVLPSASMPAEVHVW